jgi:nucleoside-diphosphate-sugar epimerase
MGMKVVVIGGTGNISGSIVKLLAVTGHDVTCYNRGLSGTLPDGVRQITGDRRDRDSFERTMQEGRFDACIDMICFSEADAQSSVRAFRGVGQFVHCSTVCTYGVDYDWMPVTEDHPLRPITGYGRGKVAADAVYLGEHYAHGFPVTIIKPSTTYGPKLGLLRQIAFDYSWIDRIRKGKPILICGNGKAPHQFLHVDDAAKAFAGVLGKQHCIGQTYNMCRRGFTTWEQYHRTAMGVIGRQVELVGIPMDTLAAADLDRFSYCVEIFAHNCYYSAEKLYRDVPEFIPTVSLEEGMERVLEAMDREGRIPDSDTLVWEDRLIEAQRAVGALRL